MNKIITCHCEGRIFGPKQSRFRWFPRKTVLSAIIVLFFACYLNCAAAEYSLSPDEKALLLSLSRETLQKYLKDGAIPAIDNKYLTPNLSEKKACFVTLDKKGTGLRGCIGMFPPVNTPLYENVIGRTIAAALKDGRFPPVEYGELKDIKIEISVLTTPEALGFSSPQDLLSKLKPLEDGVILTTEYGSSTFLPQVWEQLPAKEDFLSHLCMKHGAPANYWQTNYKNMQIAIYKVIHFSEGSYGAQ